MDRGEDRLDWDDIPHRFWNCGHCKAQNSSVDGECQYCDGHPLGRFALQHEDDCTGHVVIRTNGKGEVYRPYGKTFPVLFTQLGDDAPVILEYQGKSKEFADEDAAIESLAAKYEAWLNHVLPPIPATKR